MLKRLNKSKAPHAIQSCRVPGLIPSVILGLLVLIFFLCYNGRNRTSLLSIPREKSEFFDSPMQFNPTVEFRNGTDLIWQTPDSPKSILFVAHGCNGRAVNFWDRSPSCPKCIGLPEERLLVLNALSQKFAVVTISSAGRCWTYGKELSIVRDIIKWWVAKHRLEGLPFVALGASSGGYFVSVLATVLRFSSITLMIAEGMFDQIDITMDYPPTLFVHMPKDLHRQRKISEYREVLRNRGIDVAEVECIEFPLTTYFLAERIPALDRTTSAQLFELFRDKGFVDENGYMKKDGRATRWRDSLSKNKNLLLDTSLFHHVEEELNLAFAYHEMTSLQSEQIFKWFDSHMS